MELSEPSPLPSARASEPGRFKATAQTATWSLATQALNGASSFLLVAVVAHTSSLRDFGRFSTVMAGYALTMTSFRASIGQAAVIERESLSRRTQGAMLRVALVAGWLAGVVTCGVGVVLGTGLATGLVWIVAMPAALAQDTMRHVFLAHGVPQRAAVMDAAWLGLLVIGVAALELADATSAAATTAVWTTGAVIVAAAAMRANATSVTAGSVRSWWEEQRSTVWPLWLEGTAAIAAGNVLLVALGWTGGFSSLGQFRAGQVALAPAATYITAVQLMALRAASSPARTHQSARRASALIAAAGALGVAIWAAALLAIPNDLGRDLIGESWDPAREVLVPLSVALILSAIAAVVYAYIRARLSSRQALRTRLEAAPLDPIAGSIGAATSGAAGASWGIVASQATGLLWAIYRARGDRDPATWQRRPSD